MKARANSFKDSSNYQVKYKPVRVYNGRIRVKINELISDGNDKVKKFIEQLANIPAVTRVKFCSVTKTVVIHYTPNKIRPQEILRRLPDSSLVHETNRETEEYLDLLQNYANTKMGGDLELLNINRYGSLVTSWKIKRSVPGRIRLRNLFLLQNRSLAESLDRELAKEPQIAKCHVSHISGGVLIVYNKKMWDKNTII
jgi:hypothetical protein